MNRVKALWQYIRDAYDFKSHKSSWILIVLTVVLGILVLFTVSGFSQNSSAKQDKTQAVNLVEQKDNQHKSQAVQAVQNDTDLNDNQKFDFSTESLKRIPLKGLMKQYITNAVNGSGQKPDGIYYASGALNDYIENDLPDVLGFNNLNIGSDIQDGYVYVNGMDDEGGQDTIRNAIETIYDYSIAKKAYGNDIHVIFQSSDE